MSFEQIAHLDLITTGHNGKRNFSLRKDMQEFFHPRNPGISHVFFKFVQFSDNAIALILRKAFKNLCQSSALYIVCESFAADVVATSHSTPEFSVFSLAVDEDSVKIKKHTCFSFHIIKVY